MKREREAKKGVKKAGPKIRPRSRKRQNLAGSYRNRPTNSVIHVLENGPDSPDKFPAHKVENNCAGATIPCLFPKYNERDFGGSLSQSLNASCYLRDRKSIRFCR